MSAGPKKSAFLFPLHEPKFIYGEALISSFNKYLPGYEIFVVLSNADESEKFSGQYPHLSCKSVVYPYDINDGIINKKKYFGIGHIFNNYDFEFIGCIDSECCVEKSADIDKGFESYYQNKTLFASNTPDYDFINKVIRAPYKFFSEAEVEKLNAILNQSRLYYWFNEIPIYKRDVYQRFENHINLKENFQKLTWFDFDFILYSYYCLLYEGFEIKVITEKYLEVSFMEMQKQMSKILFVKGLLKIRPFWIKHSTIWYNQAFITFHNDRLENKKILGAAIKNNLKIIKTCITRRF